MEALTISPFALSFGLLALFGALLAGLGVARWLVRPPQADADSLLWIAVLAGLVAARLAFVFLYQDQDPTVPWSMLDILDGGFFPPAGLLAVAMTTAWLAWSNREKRAWLLYAVGGASRCGWRLRCSAGDARPA